MISENEAYDNYMHDVPMQNKPAQARMPHSTAGLIFPRTRLRHESILLILGIGGEMGTSEIHAKLASLGTIVTIRTINTDLRRLEKQDAVRGERKSHGKRGCWITWWLA